jgi:hypothetical protein
MVKKWKRNARERRERDENLKGVIGKAEGNDSPPPQI